MAGTTGAWWGTSVVATVALIAVACGSDGSAGPAGAAGAAGTPGTTGANGSNGSNGVNGATGPAGSDANSDGGSSFVVISARAKQGLDISPVPLALAGKTSAQLEQIGQGSYLVNAVAACNDCHTPSPDKFLAGGIVFPLPGPGGYSVTTRNLTPDAASGLKETEQQYIDANRNGTDFLNTGKGLVVHPWEAHRWMSTEDLKAIYSYLKVIPAVSNIAGADNKPSSSGLTFPGQYNEGAVTRALPPETDTFGQPVPDPDNVLRGLAMVPLNISAPTSASDEALYGRGSYLVNGPAGCATCHSNPPRDYQTANLALNTTRYLAGGQVIPFPPALQPIFKTVRAMSGNLTGATHGFFATQSFSTFLASITQGIHAEDVPPRPLSYPMPAAIFKHMSLSDLQAIYTYLHHVAVNASYTGPNDPVTQSAARYCTLATQAADCTGSGETCNATTNECVGRACSTAGDCDACQTCTGSVCTAPDVSSTCLTLGL